MGSTKQLRTLTRVSRFFVSVIQARAAILTWRQRARIFTRARLCSAAIAVVVKEFRQGAADGFHGTAGTCDVVLAIDVRVVRSVYGVGAVRDLLARFDDSQLW